MTRRIRRILTWGITFPWPPSWPPSWPLFRFWGAPVDVPRELAANELALKAAEAALRRRPPFMRAPGSLSAADRQSIELSRQLPGAAEAAGQRDRAPGGVVPSSSSLNVNVHQLDAEPGGGPHFAGRE
jgi:hypothetical protein